MEESRKPVRGVIGIVAALVGTFVMAFSFVNGISTALDGDSSGAGGYVALFFLGLALVIAALVFAIVHIVQKRSRILAVLTILVAAVPLGTILVLWLGLQPQGQ
jgi:glucan phosphoethanolaminetransferase (alkaline phosphatase superfamily)